MKVGVEVGVTIPVVAVGLGLDNDMVAKLQFDMLMKSFRIKIKRLAVGETVESVCPKLEDEW